MEVGGRPFHHSKRRKFMRQRPTEPRDPSPSESRVDEGSTENVANRSPEHISHDEEGESPGISDIMRLRKSQKFRKGGIGFSTSNKTGNGGGSQRSSALVPGGEDTTENDRVLGISDRFVGYTGQKVDVDKHMMAYIESEMAKRQLDSTSDGTGEASTSTHKADGAVKPTSEADQQQRQPATLGKLHEIDLGPDAKLRNIERTEAATRKLTGDEEAQPDEETSQVKKQEDKPWRGRKRRNSEDTRRDQLVEEVLRESKLDVYEEPDMGQDDDGQAADDRIAEQFRRDFMDAIQSRRRGARAKNTKNKTDVPKGPKLGGSRSARAAMREKQNKEAQK